MTDQPVHGCTIGGQPAIPVLLSEYNRLVAELAEARADLDRYEEVQGEMNERAINQERKLAALHAELEDQRAARQTAAAAADRFRDVVCEALGHDDDNPGDDTLIAELRTHFGKTGPEPTAWRDRLAGYEAIRDQINAAAREGRPA